MFRISVKTHVSTEIRLTDWWRIKFVSKVRCHFWHLFKDCMTFLHSVCTHDNDHYNTVQYSTVWNYLFIIKQNESQWVIIIKQNMRPLNIWTLPASALIAQSYGFWKSGWVRFRQINFRVINSIQRYPQSRFWQHKEIVAIDSTGIGICCWFGADWALAYTNERNSVDKC